MGHNSRFKLTTTCYYMSLYVTMCVICHNCEKQKIKQTRATYDQERSCAFEEPGIKFFLLKQHYRGALPMLQTKLNCGQAILIFILSKCGTNIPIEKHRDDYLRKLIFRSTAPMQDQNKSAFSKRLTLTFRLQCSIFGGEICNK